MKIGLISDTHGYLDQKVFQHFSDVDEIWHAGDFGSMEICEALEKFKPLRGVWGNIDSKEIRWKYPEAMRFEAEGLKILIIHIAGAPGKYPSSVRKEIMADPPDLLVCGHSHILRVFQDPKLNGMIYINPGAAGNQGWHKIRTIMKMDLVKGKIENMKAIELGKRGK